MFITKKKHNRLLEELRVELENKREEQLLEIGILAEEQLKKTVDGYEANMKEAEEIIAKYEAYMSNLDANIKIADKKLTEIDSSGHFRADDEIGFFFQTVKTIQNTLNNFMVKKTQ